MAFVPSGKKTSYGDEIIFSTLKSLIRFLIESPYPLLIQVSLHRKTCFPFGDNKSNVFRKK
jgi:hypothetical protein